MHLKAINSSILGGKSWPEKEEAKSTPTKGRKIFGINGICRI
jgi:hypothetical protein